MTKTELVYCSVVALLVAAALLFTCTPCLHKMVVKGSSMEPTLREGDLVLGYAPSSFEELRVGDIVTFRWNGIYVTHRIAELNSENRIVTRGDNVEGAGEIITFKQIVFVVLSIKRDAATSLIVTYAEADLPTVEAQNFWQYLYEGDFVGLGTALLISIFQSQTIVAAVFYLLFSVPLYIRTKSLMLLCILWILLGSFIIVAMPEIAGFAILFTALGIAGLLWRLFRPSSTD